jgi:hypothetical protein
MSKEIRAPADNTVTQSTIINVVTVNVTVKELVVILLSSRNFTLEFGTPIPAVLCYKAVIS